VDVPRSNRPQNVVRWLFRLNVSLNVAEASSRLSSRVISGMVEMKRSVRFSSVKGCFGDDADVRLLCCRSSRAVRVAPPVMRIGVRC
jgi:hypothetical protein